VRKPSPKSNQATLTAEQQERLMESCRVMGYYRAAMWAEKELGLQTSTASLSRWYQKQAQEMTAGKLREMLQGSEEFDAQLDRKQVDARIANALRTKFFEVIQGTEDVETVKAFGALVLNFVRNEQNDERLDVMRRKVEHAEELLKISQDKFRAIEDENKALKAKLAEVSKPVLDTSAVADALDAQLGRATP
jgi:hypothetical protein